MIRKQNNSLIFARSFFIIFLFILTLFPTINNPYFIIGWGLALSVFIKIKNTSIKFCTIDVLICSLWLYCFISILITSNRIIEISSASSVTISFLYYLIIRLYYKSAQSIVILLKMISIVVSIFSIIGCVAFFIFEKSIHSLEFDNIYHFRSLLTPLGMPSNSWNNILLGFLGILLFSIVYKIRHKQKVTIPIISLIPVILGLITSFSRGIYISLVFILFILFNWTFTTKLIKQKQKIITLISTIFIFMVIGFCYKTEVLQTLKFNDTISQQRSTKNRIETTKSSFTEAKNNLLFGTGYNSWLSTMNDSRYESDNIPITSIAPNIISQILIEKGLFGLLICITVILIIVIIYLGRARDDLIYTTIIVVMLFIFLREMTYSTLLSSLSLQLILLTMIGIGENAYIKNQISCKISCKKKAILLSFPLFVCLIITITLVLNDKDKTYNKEAITLIDNKQFRKAIETIDKTSTKASYLINRSSIYWETYWQTKKNYYLDLAYDNLQKAIDKYPKFPQLKHSLSYIEFTRGNIPSAINMLRELTIKYPDNALYNYSLFNLYYKSEQNKIESVMPNIIQAIKLSPVGFI